MVLESNRDLVLRRLRRVPRPRPHQAPGRRGHLARPGADDPQAGRPGPARGLLEPVRALRRTRASRQPDPVEPRSGDAGGKKGEERSPRRRRGKASVAAPEVDPRRRRGLARPWPRWPWPPPRPHAAESAEPSRRLTRPPEPTDRGRGRARGSGRVPGSRRAGRHPVRPATGALRTLAPRRCRVRIRMRAPRSTRCLGAPSDCDPAVTHPVGPMGSASSVSPPRRRREGVRGVRDRARRRPPGEGRRR